MLRRTRLNAPVGYGRPSCVRTRLVELARFVAPALFLLLASCVGPAPTFVVVEPFPVSGRTFQAALENTNALDRDTMLIDGRHAFAAVSPTWLTSFRRLEGRSTCRYDPRGRFALRTTVKLPDWRQRARADELDGQKWDVLLHYAAIHEARHIAIFQKYTRMMTDVYRRTSAATCDELEEAIARQLRAVYDAMRREHDLFDATDLPRMRRFLRAHGFDIVG